MGRYQPILTLLPPAILAALCAPSILFNKQIEAETLDFTQLIAALVTIILAKYCRSLLWPIIGGMGCLWIVRWVL
jgi:branched-subunit amino acid transport protein